MGNLGFGEILALLVIGLLLFGAKRLPELGRSVGQAVAEFKRGLSVRPEEKNRSADHE